MAGEEEGQIRVEGSLVHLDATPARLLSQLGTAGGAVTVTAMTPDGVTRHEPLPPEVRRARYQLSGRSIEATPAARFVAVTTAKDRLVVAVLDGDVVVVTSSGERTALAAHETIISEAPDAEPRVVVTADLAGDDRAAVEAAIDDATASLTMPLAAVEEAPQDAAAPVAGDLPAEVSEEVGEDAGEEAGEEVGDEIGEEVAAAVSDEERVERRGVALGLAIGAVVAVIALVIGLTVLTGDDDVVLTPPAPTTTDAAPTTAAPTTEPPATTAAPTTTAAPVADYDIAPESCRQSGGTVTLTGRVTNNADEAWRFTVTVAFSDTNGDELDRSSAAVGPVAPGATETFTVSGTTDERAAGCDIVDVEPSRAG